MLDPIIPFLEWHEIKRPVFSPPLWLQREPVSGQAPISARAENLELAAIGILWLQLFLLIATLVFGRCLGSALFLGQFDGRGLAAIYVLTGLAVAGMFLAVERFASRWSGWIVAVATLVVLFGATLTSGLLLIRADGRWHPILVGAFYLVIESFSFLTTVQYWGNVNSTLSMTQARRHYSLLGTGGILGSLAGAGLASQWSGITVARGVLLIAAVIPIQIATILLFQRISLRLARLARKRSLHWNLPNAHARPALAEVVPSESTAAGVSWAARFGAVSLLMVFSTTLVDFYYKVHADWAFGGAASRLTAFFGNFYLCVGLATLLAQLTVTPWILRRADSFVGLWASPVCLAMLAMVNLVLPGIWTAALLKWTDSVLSHGVYRSCQEILYTPLPTRWVRPLKSLSDGVYGRHGLMLAGVFLFVLAPTTEGGARGLLPWILLSLAGWFWAVRRLKLAFENAHRLVSKHLATEQSFSRPTGASTKRGLT